MLEQNHVHELRQGGLSRRTVSFLSKVLKLVPWNVHKDSSQSLSKLVVLES